MTKPVTVAEIVTFRLADGADETAFISAAAAVEDKLQSSGQMLARTLSRTEDGLWTDHVIWRSQEAASAAAQEVMQSPVCAPFLALIDNDSVAMSHGAIARRMD
ncbi:hypothetical protein [Antarcticimicrobium luteum]|uniref:ABM domain-containing protein n=1 Tax=Antarcticimicrobium luteum TaxID=2547397 RepID=A0A4R5UV76_9RHOB|nr:hypothetical protein [Antarcticimicrobium luteum]TDK43021.1 hypothetical protein E1832_17300 [Antarcticimicrobium luteum]